MYAVISKNRKGFTLIELLVVISIIGLISSIVVTSVNAARAKARDARRMADVDTIVKALIAYKLDHGTYLQVSGCGSGSNSNGWFNQPYSGGKSMAQCLIDAGYLAQEIIDPSGNRTAATINDNVYMKYTCGGVTYVLANLETLPHTTGGPAYNVCATTFGAGVIEGYGMNYVKEIR